MGNPRTPEKSPEHPAGAAAWGPSLGLLAVAVGIVAGTLAWWWTSRAPEPVAQAPAARAAAIVPVAASGPAPAAAPVVVSAAASASPALPQAAPALPAPRIA